VTQTAPPLTTRYGGPRKARRRALTALVVLLAVAGLAWTGWAAWLHATPVVESDLVSFDVHGQHRVDAQITVVRRDPSVRAHCSVQAVAADHSIVGLATFTVGPDGTATQTRGVSIRTDRAATSVTLVGCTAPGQRRAQ
jgi:hypothetical protein